MTFADRTISDFLEDVASATVTPSGGAVAAIGGAAGAALCEMACVHTLGKDGYAEVEREIAGVRDDLGTDRTRLLELADEDSAAVDELQAVFGTSGRDGHERAMQDAAKHATEVPLETAEKCLAVLEGATVVTKEGNRNAIADAGTGAFLAHAALQASVSTVGLNLGMIEDATFVAQTRDRTTEIDDSAETALEQVQTNVGDAR